jgi:hypothetical protein
MEFKKQMERFSFAMASSICAQAGCSWDEPSYDDGVDLIIHGSKLRRRPLLLTQLKSIHDFRIIKEKQGLIKYPLRSKNYNDLVAPACNPQLLVVAIIPKDPQIWVRYSEHQFSLQYGLYYSILEGEQPTSHTRSVTIDIPLKQRFDNAALSRFMENISSKGSLI